MNSTFRLLFYARWQKRKANGKVPLYARVTIDGTKVEFNVKMDVSEKIWDPKFGRASGNSREAVTLNQYLTSIAGKLKEKYLLMTEQGLVVTASMLKDAYLGVNIKTNTLLGIFKEFNDRQESLIGIEIAQSTFNKYDLTYRRLQEFLRVKKKTSDIL
ncbi:MAG: site-specific integrase, partial [Rikenellaceae bacterium]|nr:site-specific integrase [Rikenellaceae bacterium]